MKQSNIFLKILNKNIVSSPLKKALVSADKEFTWEELYNFAEKHSLFIAANFSETDFVPLLISNPFDFVTAVYTIWLSGKVVVPINPLLPIMEIEEILSKTKTTGIITDNLTAIKELQNNYEILRWDSDNNSDFYRKEKSKSVPIKNSCDNALILFTSGSTGFPKGVIISFSNLLANVRAIENLLSLSNRISWMASLPLFHIGGFAIIFRALHSCSTLYLPESFSSTDVINSLLQFHPSLFSVVSTTLRRIIDEVNPYNELKAVFAGGGPISGNLMKAAIDKGFPVYKVYGSTETTSMISVLKPDEVNISPESAGKILDGIEVEIQNPDSKRVGEICVKGKQISQGYFSQSDKEVRSSYDEFFCTGDLGFVDSNGFLNIVGRKSAFIISGGENINLNKVKKSLLSFPDITDAEAFGMPDEKWGEKLVAVVVATKKINLYELKTYLKSYLSAFEIPKEVKQVDFIPKTALGKNEIRKLKEQF